MADFIFLTHAHDSEDGDWGAYIAKLNAAGVFRGGSAMGDGVCVKKVGNAPAITAHLGGYIKIAADDLAHAQKYLTGHPTYESGGVVEIRELPETD